MTNKTLKLIAGFVLVLSLSTPALAVAPLVLTALELAAPVVVAAGVSFLMPSSATSNLPKTGYADNYGVKRNLLARVGTTAAIAVTGAIAYNELRSLVGDPTTDTGNLYPSLSNKLYLDKNGSILPVNNQSTVGQYATFGDYGVKKITSRSTVPIYLNNTGYIPSPNPMLVNPSYGTYRYFWKADGSNAVYYYDFNTVDEQPPPAYEPQPDILVAPTLTSPTLNDLYPEVLSDLDKLIQANPSALQVPVTLSNDVRDAQKQLALDTQKQASAARVASLKEVRDARQAAYDANPTPENKEALDKAEAEYQEALADDAELTLNSAKDAEADSPLTPPEPPEYDTINFQPLVDMGEELGDKFPFSLLATLKNFATGLVTTPRAPAFDITFPAPFNHTWHVSLDRFDGIAQMVRVLIGMAFLGYCTMAIIRRWQ